MVIFQWGVRQPETRQRWGSGARLLALRAGLVIALSAAAPPGATAESVSESLSWLGCWQKILPDGEESGSLASQPLTCVAPGTSRNSLSRTERLAQRTLSEQTLHLDNRRHEVDTGGCTGWQTTHLSEGGARIYLRSELSCAGNHERKLSAVSMLTAVDEWLDISGR